MLDHIGLAVADFERSKSFFVNALVPLDITLIMEVTTSRQATTATVPRTARVGSFCSTAAPIKRPIMAPNQ